MNYQATAERHKPDCPVCLMQMQRVGFKRYPTTGSVSFRYGCRTCKKTVNINFREIGPEQQKFVSAARIPIKPLTKYLVEQHRPECSKCLCKMGLRTTRIRTSTGALALEYTCHKCGVTNTVPLNKARPLRPLPQSLTPERVSELIGSVISSQFEDSIQDTWLKVLSLPATCEADILRIAQEIQHKDANQTIFNSHNMSLDDPLFKEGRENEDKIETIGDILPAEDESESIIDMLDARYFSHNPTFKVSTTQKEESTDIDLNTLCRKQVAKAILITPVYLGRILNGKATCTLPLAYDLSKYLGTTIDNLYRNITGANGQNPSRKFRIDIEEKGVKNEKVAI